MQCSEGNHLVSKLEETAAVALAYAAHLQITCVLAACLEAQMSFRVAEIKGMQESLKWAR